MIVITVSLIWVVIFIATVLFLTRRSNDSISKQGEDKINALRSEWSETLSKNTDLILNQLNNMNNSVGSQLSNTAKVFGEVRESIGSLDQKTKQIYEVGKDISSLHEILRAPKMRGGLGELFLENLLEQVMPRKDFYTLQYSFKSGERVDAVIKIGKKLVPVDSKFPMESFTRFIQAENDEDKKRAKKEFVKAIREHINSIADKYILPDEDTYDFALMYIPAENVYYEAIIKDEDFGEQKSIFSHAIARKVIPVSPNSFYAYLQVIILGLRGMGIEEKTQEVIKKLITLRGSLERFKIDFDKMGTHIENIKSSYDRAEDRLEKFGNKISSIDSLNGKKQIEEK
ncbi:MAG: DNA recombination protein RmuC [Candidatus Omnitrophica bacterium]|nr:DNA recombination protein RmuC [Candidatus Omnitrophota bacterium]